MQLILALRKSLGSHLKEKLFLALSVSSPNSPVLLIVSRTTRLPLPPNIRLCRVIEAEPHRRTIVRGVFPIVLNAPPTTRLCVRASIRMAILLGTTLCLTSACTKTNLALDVVGNLILTLPNLTLMSTRKNLSPLLRSTGLTSVRPLLCRLMEY